MNEEKSYRITPKGILAAIMSDLHPSITLDDAMQAISKFEQKIKSRADFDEQRGIPCVVLSDDGWNVISVIKQKAEETP